MTLPFHSGGGAHQPWLPALGAFIKNVSTFGGTFDTSLATVSISKKISLKNVSVFGQFLPPSFSELNYAICTFFKELTYRGSSFLRLGQKYKNLRMFFGSNVNFKFAFEVLFEGALIQSSA